MATKSTKKKATKPASKKAQKGKKKSAQNELGLKEWFSQLKSGETSRFIIGLLLICVAIFFFIAFISFILNGEADDVAYAKLMNGQSVDTVDNAGGILGLKTAAYFIQEGFGFPAIFIPIFMVMLSMKLMKTHIFKITQQFINCAFLMIWGSTALAFFFPDGLGFFKPGGQHGLNVCDYLNSTIGNIGVILILVATMLTFCIYLTRATIEWIRKMLDVKNHYEVVKEKGPWISSAPWNKHKEEEDSEDKKHTDPSTGTEFYIFGGDNKDKAEEGPLYPDDEEKPTVIDLGTNTMGKELRLFEPELEVEQPAQPEPEPEPEPNPQGDELELEIESGEEDEEADGDDFERGSLDTPYDPKLDFEYYKYPSIDLLKKYPESDSAIDMEEQQANKERIINVLRNFGVEISSIKATVGPTITLYEITPAKGVRIAKIRNLEDDIALSLSAIGIRIIAPIPGKGTIGIEVPNAKPKIVSMESVINSRKFQECEYELPIALGRTITNEIYIQDLAKMPHLLVAGATGQGKSVGLNAIISSLLFKKHPTELKFVLVDPKKVEFSIYAPLEDNFMAEVSECEGDPVITDTDKVKHTLKSLCQEMDDRYMLLKSAGTRNIKEYNAKFTARRLNPNNGHRYLPYIVVIIDEFGDLIMVAGKEIEHPITRIAQLARAVGIHMVIATQRPTTNIITGNIKANFPARMAFRVTASIDSRTILDQMGANQLVGRGDMLFLASGKPAERVQCAFIDTPEVEALNDFISEQSSPLRAYELPEVAIGDDEYGGGMDGDGPIEKFDSMFVDVARYVVNGQQGSTSAIQRTFAIGYNRAGRLMDQLEKAKIVGPARGSKPREVLIVDETDLNVKLEALHLI